MDVTAPHLEAVAIQTGMERRCETVHCISSEKLDVSNGKLDGSCEEPSSHLSRWKYVYHGHLSEIERPLSTGAVAAANWRGLLELPKTTANSKS